MERKIITITEDGYLNNLLFIDSEEIPQELYKEGFRFADDSTEIPTPTIEQFETYQVPFSYYAYDKESDTYKMCYRFISDKDQISNAIKRTKEELASTDYIFTKLLEYSMIPLETAQEQELADQEMEQYDINKLHKERNELRTKINQLRTLIDKEQ